MNLSLALEDLAWAKWAYEQNFQHRLFFPGGNRHVHEESWAGDQEAIFTRREWRSKRIYPQENFSLLDLIRLFFRNAVNDLTEAAREKKRKD